MKLTREGYEKALAYDAAQRWGDPITVTRQWEDSAWDFCVQARECLGEAEVAVVSVQFWRPREPRIGYAGFVDPTPPKYRPFNLRVA
jgi:hypothetical protein